MENTLVICPCGLAHPLGFICEDATSLDKARENKAKAECSHGTVRFRCDHAAVTVDTCGHGDLHDQVAQTVFDHDDSCGLGACCRHTHPELEAVDFSSVGDVTANRAIYRILNMDCPMEEALIRKKLGNLPHITGLEFNLMQRVLTVNHNLPSAEPIVAALQAIDMTPEPLGRDYGALAVFSISGTERPVEENLIKTKLSMMPGVIRLEFDPIQRTLKVQHEQGALPAISEALISLNTDARLVDMEAATVNTIPRPKIPWINLTIAGVCAALSEAFELLREWKGSVFGIDLLGWKPYNLEPLEWLPAIFALLAIACAGLSTYRKGWLAVRNFNLNINALMSVAVTGATFIGQYPEAAMVMVLFNLSEAIEAKALDKARSAIKNLLALAPEKATVVGTDGTLAKIDVRLLAKGSRVRVKPGEKVALDGVIVTGQSAINQAPITGESLPVEKTVGDTVYAGTINESGSFEFEATAVATNSTLARIIHAVEEAQSSRAPMQRFVDQFARYYTPAVFLIALLVAVVPPLATGTLWAKSVYSALVILVIGCPCALVISTPISIVSGMVAATRYGILIKGGMFLEQGRLLNWIALDKTGTITHGKPRQTDFVELGSLGGERTRILAASIAARSDHPVSRAIVENATGTAPLLDVEDFLAIPGQGVSGVISGEKWYLGNHRMIEELKKGSATLEMRMLDLEQQGKTVVALVSEKGVHGLFAVADTLKESSVDAISHLRKLGVKTMMLTGDNEHTAKAIAQLVGVDCYQGNLLPEDKLRIVEKLKREGNKVGMVGDGINDAPALARANVGFAMAGGGTDTAIETADVALMDDDLLKIPRFISLSKSTYAILVQNITLALTVKVLFFALTFSGMATMWMAVFADVGTALIVVANGLRAMRRKGDLLAGATGLS